jgi:hypothetical protein
MRHKREGKKLIKRTVRIKGDSVVTEHSGVMHQVKRPSAGLREQGWSYKFIVGCS